MISTFSKLQLVIAAFGLCPVFGLAQLSIEPTGPRAQETVLLRVPTSLTGPTIFGSSEVSMASNKISVSLRAQPFSPPPAQPPITEIVLGQFPVGAYTVEFFMKDSLPGGVIASMQFNVAGANEGALTPRANYTDIWWNSAESGYGLSITQHINNKLFALWFVYGADGKAVWFSMSDCVWFAINRCAGAVFRSTGPSFGGPFNSAPVVTSPVGTANLIFVEYGLATFDYLIEGVAGSKSLRRMGF